jgi:hypothetical protein
MSGQSIFQIRTMEDMERYYYGLGLGNDVMKADAPILTSTSGIYNPIYGAKIWSQLNLEANTFAMLPKAVWDHSGFRVLTAKPVFTYYGQGGYTVAPGGVAENSAIPDTQKPTWAQLYSKPKTIVHPFNASEAAQFMGTIDDALGDYMKQMREYMGLHHAEHINRMLNAEGVVGTAVQEGYDAQSLDRIFSRKTESDGTMDMADGSTPPHAASNDVYVNGSTIDRSDSSNFSWADAIVNWSGTKGALRSLTLDVMDSTFKDIWQAGGTPKVIQCGYDSLKATQRLLQAQQRFVEFKTVVPTYGGVKGVEGVQAGFIVATYNGVPMIPTKDALQDQPSGTPAGLSRMYFMDTDYLTIKVAKPTQYFEAGISTGNPFAVNAIGDKGLYRTMLDLICTRFNVQAKIRDLKE